MLDAYFQQNVFGFENVFINSKGSVASFSPSAHLWLVNEEFDEEFVQDFTLALKNLRDRINAVVA